MGKALEYAERGLSDNPQARACFASLALLLP